MTTSHKKPHPKADKTTAPAPTGAATLPGAAVTTVSGGAATTTTATTTVGAVISDIEVGANLVSSILGDGKLSIVDDVARAAVKAAVTQLQSGVDHLVTSVNADVSASPIFKTALPVAKSILATLGIALPGETQIANGIKAAIADLAGAITPPAAVAAAV